MTTAQQLRTSLDHSNIRHVVRPLMEAQFEWTAQMLREAITHDYSDDGFDYLRGALDLSSSLLNIDYECDVEDFTTLLLDIDPANMCNVLLAHACDGICPEIYEWMTTTHGEGWEDRMYGLDASGPSMLDGQPL